jgi:hypothetical protein
MAIANSYPMGTPKSDDLLLGTSVPTPGTNEKATTKNFGIEAVASLVSRGFLEVTKTLTNAEWITLKTAGIIIVPATTGKYIQVVSAYASFIHTGANFLFSSDLVLSSRTTITNLTLKDIQARIPQDFEDIDGNEIAIFGLEAAKPILSAPLYFNTLSTATNAGGGTVAVTVRYQVI